MNTNNPMRPGQQILITGGAFEGFTGIIRETDGAWLFVILRDGRLLWLAASLCQLCDGENPS